MKSLEPIIGTNRVCNHIEVTRGFTSELGATYLFFINLLFRLMLKLKKCGLLSLPGYKLPLFEGLGGIPNGPEFILRSPIAIWFQLYVDEGV